MTKLNLIQHFKNIMMTTLFIMSFSMISSYADAAEIINRGGIYTKSVDIEYGWDEWDFQGLQEKYGDKKGAKIITLESNFTKYFLQDGSFYYKQQCTEALFPMDKNGNRHIRERFVLPMTDRRGKNISVGINATEHTNGLIVFQLDGKPSQFQYISGQYDQSLEYMIVNNYCAFR